ncbi:hypothetical protein PoB_005675200 [Plakobranchus ocellatus]|uniref:Uncharacterized protein n=1 Tax=Plakobranchus ocellatus TaxID=259542 RepID=A0AAV4CFT5_9GAST|nr:hypothetical protein PoB_005675200 [Plakobranchus ocellatus]
MCLMKGYVLSRACDGGSLLKCWVAIINNVSRGNGTPQPSVPVITFKRKDILSRSSLQNRTRSFRDRFIRSNVQAGRPKSVLGCQATYQSLRGTVHSEYALGSGGTFCRGLEPRHSRTESLGERRTSQSRDEQVMSSSTTRNSARAECVASGFEDSDDESFPVKWFIQPPKRLLYSGGSNWEVFKLRYNCFVRERRFTIRY